MKTFVPLFLPGQIVGFIDRNRSFQKREDALIITTVETCYFEEKIGSWTYKLNGYGFMEEDSLETLPLSFEKGATFHV